MQLRIYFNARDIKLSLFVVGALFVKGHLYMWLNKISVSTVLVLSMEYLLDLIIVGMGKEEGPDQSAQTTSAVV